MKKILITGGAGFIGSHLAELFVEEGFDVVAFDRYNSNNNWKGKTGNRIQQVPFQKRNLCASD